MEKQIEIPRSAATCTQPVRINLRSYVMRMLEKERLHPDGIPSTSCEDSPDSLTWRKENFGAFSPQI
jgi:hypothetical protein